MGIASKPHCVHALTLAGRSILYLVQYAGHRGGQGQLHHFSSVLSFRQLMCVKLSNLLSGALTCYPALTLARGVVWKRVANSCEGLGKEIKEKD